MFIEYKLYVSNLSASSVGNIFFFCHYVVSDTQRHTHRSSCNVHSFCETLTKIEAYDQIFSKLFSLNFTKFFFIILKLFRANRYTNTHRTDEASGCIFNTVVNVPEMK
jgi:hypothetical protein